MKARPPFPAVLAAVARSTQDDLRRHYARRAQSGCLPSEAMADALGSVLITLRSLGKRAEGRAGSEEAAMAIDELASTYLAPLDPARATFGGVMRMLDRLVAAGEDGPAIIRETAAARGSRVRQLTPSLERLAANGMQFPAKGGGPAAPVDGLIFALELMQQIERTRKPDLLVAGDLMRLGAQEMLDDLFSRQIAILEAAKADGRAGEAVQASYEFFRTFDALQVEHHGAGGSRQPWKPAPVN